MSCSEGNCLVEAEFYCDCRNKTLGMCVNHSNLHCQTPGMHKLIRIHTVLTSEEQETVLKMLLLNQKAIKEMKNTLEKFTKGLIEEIYQLHSKALKEATQIEKNIIANILTITTQHKVNKEVYDYQMKISDMEYVIDLDFFKESEILLKTQNFYLKKFMQSIKLQHNSANNLTSIMVFFQKNSKLLTRINILDLSIDTTEVSIEKSMGGSAGWCQLPDKKVFHYGGQKSQLLQPVCTCCIIDPGYKTILIRASGPEPLYSIGICCYFNNYVYIFGGSTSFSALSMNAYRFDLKQNNWSQLASMPYPSENNISYEHNGVILITGCRIGLAKYEPSIDKYSVMIEKIEGHKIMFTEGEKIFLLIQGRLIVKNGGNWEQKGNVSAVPESEYLKSYCVRHMLWIYFLLSNNVMYRFNLRNEIFEEVRVMKFDEKGIFGDFGKMKMFSLGKWMEN